MIDPTKPPSLIKLINIVINFCFNLVLIFICSSVINLDLFWKQLFSYNTGEPLKRYRNFYCQCSQFKSKNLVSLNKNVLLYVTDRFILEKVLHNDIIFVHNCSLYLFRAAPCRLMLVLDKDALFHVCLSLHSCVQLSICLSICLFNHPSVCSSVCLLFGLSVLLSVSLCIYLGLTSDL